MKTKKIILIAATVFLLSGCFIKSLYPFYTEKDIVFDNSIIGTWMDNDSSKWIIKQHSKWMNGKANSYQVGIVEKGGEKSTYNVHLFKLNNQLYLDFYPIGSIAASSMAEENIVATHSLAKITYTSKTIKVQWFNEMWMEQLLKQNKIRIKHEKLNVKDTGGYTSNYLLTASTKDLQKFIIKYGNDSLAFKSIWESDSKKRNEEALTLNLKKISNDAN
ncbi:MAG: hypothetical protein ACD_79C01445G0002 [uncultured bacterium]|nr:MAG: hypothetical protein ACD_79C01445G0002 [uncultured bacterium]